MISLFTQDLRLQDFVLSRLILCREFSGHFLLYSMWFYFKNGMLLTPWFHKKQWYIVSINFLLCFMRINMADISLYFYRGSVVMSRLKSSIQLNPERKITSHCNRLPHRKSSSTTPCIASKNNNSAIFRTINPYLLKEFCYLKLTMLMLWCILERIYILRFGSQSFSIFNFLLKFFNRPIVITIFSGLSFET